MTSQHFDTRSEVKCKKDGGGENDINSFINMHII